MSKTVSSSRLDTARLTTPLRFVARSSTLGVNAIPIREDGRKDTPNLEIAMSQQNNIPLFRSLAKIRAPYGRVRQFLLAAVSAALVTAAPPVLATPLNLSTVPLFLTSTTKPNVVVIYDNSESMDGTMAGKLIAGSDSTTRGNIGRQVMRDTITTYRNSFRWGLMSYGYTGTAALYNTYAYYLGKNTSMMFTDDCVNGISASNGNLRCVANPQSFTPGGAYVTYASTGDDPSINDVLYTTGVYTSLWGLSAAGNSTKYNIYTTHKTTSGNSWATTAFSGSQGTWNFTPTDAGYLPSSPTITRQLYLPRAWGYLNSITGAGTINEPVQSDSTTHFNNLMAKLASETNTSTSEIKNAAVYTPLTGSLQSAKTYLSTSFQGNASPITDTCQKNFVILVTDGLPTGKTDGTLYSTADRTNTYNNGSHTWTWGVAVQDAINAATALRSITKSGITYDVQTYVVALGDTVQNAEAIAAMNAIASAGGTGSAYLATNETTFQSAINTVALDIQAKTASASAVAVNSQVLTASTRTYQARFMSAVWSGQLLAFPITSNTVGTQVWDAGAQLKSQAWDTGANARQIITQNGSQGIPFRWTTSGANALSSSQQTVLNTNPASSMADGQGQARLDYLRGDCSNEGAGYNYRLRTVPNTNPAPPCQFKLGDIANSTPFYVGTPAVLPDTLESATNSSFRATYASRPAMIYVGANDGMLHGFADADGSEKIAYVPNIAFSSLNQLTNTLYAHRYFVDGSPVVGDVFGIFPNSTGIGTCSTTGCWRTVLTSGLAGGGKGIFTLDVTDPTGIGSGPSFTESNANKISLWEFTDSNGNDMGYVYGQPVIAKMHSTTTNPNGDWAVIFGNGYNSVNENAVLYVVSVTDGSLIAKIPLVPTGYSATGNSNGLASPAVFDTDNDYKTDYIYVGDLRGNMWKIDVTSATPASWGSAYTKGGKPAPLFTATDADSGGNPQPITEKPYVSKHPVGGQTGQMVYFGTGRYITTTDNAGATSPIQTLYGIWDGNPSSGSLSGSAAVTRDRLLTQTIGTSGNARSLTTYTITTWGNSGTACNNNPNPPPVGNTCMGWKEDLLTATAGSIGEMSVFLPVPISTTPSRIVYTTLIPLSSACSAGGTSWLMEVDPVTGGALSSAVLDIDGDGKITSADNINGTPAAGLLSTIGIEPNPVIVHDSSTGNDSKILSGSSGAINIVVNYNPGSPPPTSTSTGRKSWRQLQ